MSNFHAKISYHARSNPVTNTQSGFNLHDVGSTNRTWLRLSAEGEQSNLHPLKIGDILKIGSTVFVVESSDIHNLKNMPVINKRVQPQAPYQEQAREDAEDGQMPDELMLDEEENKDDIGETPFQAQPGKQSAEMCKLCYGADCDAAFIPCGHVTACVKCAGRCKQCPVCRMPYHDIMKLYKQ